MSRSTIPATVPDLPVPWPDPILLGEGERPPFPLHTLPRWQADAAQEIATSKNASPDMAAAFILGATNVRLPSYRTGFLAILKRFSELGIDEIRGHRLYALSEIEYEAAYGWLERAGILALIADSAEAYSSHPDATIGAVLDAVSTRYLESWQAEAVLKTYGEAIADGETELRAETLVDHQGPRPWRHVAFLQIPPLEQANAQCLEIIRSDQRSQSG